MLRKFCCLIIAVVFAGFLTACKKESTNGSSTTTTETSTLDPNGLPSDIPIHPKAEFAGKRNENQKEVFDYRVKASVLEISNFYDKELRKRSWDLIPNPNKEDAEGMTFFKSDRSVKVVYAKKDGVTDVQLVLSHYVPKPEMVSEAYLKAQETEQAQNAQDTLSKPGVDIKGDAESIKALQKSNINLGDALKFPSDVPPDVPRYPGAEEKESRRPIKWREFSTNDSVEKISSFYAEKMAANGWRKHLDTSELGDTMVVYAKGDDKGGTRFIGVRVNNMKDYRNLTIILYPENVVIPTSIKPRTQIMAEQKEQYEAIQKAMEESKKQQAAKAAGEKKK